MLKHIINSHCVFNIGDSGVDLLPLHHNFQVLWPKMRKDFSTYWVQNCLSQVKISETVYSLSGFWNCLFWKRQTTGFLFTPGPCEVAGFILVSSYLLPGVNLRKRFLNEMMRHCLMWNPRSRGHLYLVSGLLCSYLLSPFCPYLDPSPISAQTWSGKKVWERVVTETSWIGAHLLKFRSIADILPPLVLPTWKRKRVGLGHIWPHLKPIPDVPS